MMFQPDERDWLASGEIDSLKERLDEAQRGFDTVSSLLARSQVQASELLAERDNLNLQLREAREANQHLRAENARIDEKADDESNLNAVLMKKIEQFQAKEEQLEPVPGDLLPPIGAKVLIHLNSQNEWVEHTVVGYYVWGALSHQIQDGEKDAYRVAVRVRDAKGYLNARLLSEIKFPKSKERI